MDEVVEGEEDERGKEEKQVIGKSMENEDRRKWTGRLT